MVRHSIPLDTSIAETAIPKFAFFTPPGFSSLHNRLQEVAHKLHWLKLAEQASLVSVGVGAIAAGIYQQLAYASVPTAISLVLNYRRFNQLEKKDNTAAITQVRQDFLADFTCVVRYVQNKGVRVEVVSWRRHTSNSLISTADHYIDLESLKD